MSLIVGIKASEGITLAADSLIQQGDATFLTARKLFTLRSQSHIAVAFCGLMQLGGGKPLPASMLMEAVDTQLENEQRGRMSVEDFADFLSEILTTTWHATMPEGQVDPAMEVVVAGIDADARYGEVLTFRVPTNPEAGHLVDDECEFAMGYWGNTRGLRAMIEPYEFLFQSMPLESCVALAEFVIDGTSRLESWSDSPQRVGGPVDCLTITQAAGVRWVRRKAFWSE